jgi:signal transduction histidine kinase
MRDENHLRAARITSNTRRTITYFVEERLDALRFIIQEKELRYLKSDVELHYLLRDLKTAFGGLVDIGLIDSSGVQVNYAGPFDLTGKNYSHQEWFSKCAGNGAYVSDVFMGYRMRPHMIIALRWVLGDGTCYILRTTLDIKKLIEILSSLELSEKSDAFLINRHGLLQTPSKYYGEIFRKVKLPIPEYSPRTKVMEAEDLTGEPILIGYAYIENSPYILMLVKRSEEIMKGWYSLRNHILLLFCGSTLGILIVIYGLSTFMVNEVYGADQARLKAMERLESSSRLISMGRLAAGVAHEINNPLAVINENAGLIRDLFILKKEYKEDPQLMELIDDVLESVERSGEITKQLLGFARHFEPKIEELHLKMIASEVLSFLRKEALYRNISINVDIPDDLPVIQSDHGSLQQIFLNLINNALQAMKNGGQLDISADRKGNDTVYVSIKDDGCGISPEDQKKIFEPFFTTKGVKGGTGLGLSITFGLVRKLNGDISVRSKVGEGTTFIVTLPITFEGDILNEDTAG